MKLNNLGFNESITRFEHFRLKFWGPWEMHKLRQWLNLIPWPSWVKNIQAPLLFEKWGVQIFKLNFSFCYGLIQSQIVKTQRQRLNLNPRPARVKNIQAHLWEVRCAIITHLESENECENGLIYTTFIPKFMHETHKMSANKCVDA